jgi:ribosomal protein L21E
LKRSIERHLVFPLSNLLATKQVQLGDLVLVDFDASLSKLVFLKENQGALVGGQEDRDQETALVAVSMSQGAGTRALARRAAHDST